MQSLSFFFLRIKITLFSLLPFSFVFTLSDGFAWMLRKVIKYRKSIIRQNFRNSFPGITGPALMDFERQFYSYFADLLLETIKGMTADKEEMKRRFIYKGTEIFEELHKEGKSAILVGGHYGNWEWATLTFPMVVQHKVIGIYKPIKNNKIDEYLNRIRARWGNNLVSMARTGRTVIEHRNEPCIYVLIADQTPSDIKNAHWLHFLNQDTPFLHGTDKLARQTGYPLIFCKVTRPSRGYYEMTFEKLSDNASGLPVGEVTRLFAMALEQQIMENPGFWLWSHRRWKRKRRISNKVAL